MHFFKPEEKNKGKESVGHFLVFLFTCHWRSGGEGHGTEPEDEADALCGPLRPTDVEGDGAEHGDEAAIEDAHDERDDHHGRELHTRHQRGGRQQHRAAADHIETQLRGKK